MAYEVKVLADAALALPWMLIRRGKDVTLCIQESLFDKAPVLQDVTAGARMFPDQRVAPDA